MIGPLGRMIQVVRDVQSLLTIESARQPGLYLRSMVTAS